MIWPAELNCVKGANWGEGAGVAVGADDAGEMHTHGGHIGGAENHVFERLFNPRRIVADVTVAKISGNAKHGKWLRLVAGGERGEISLEARHVDGRIGRHVAGAARGKRQLAGGGVDRRQLQGGHGVRKGHRERPAGR